MIGGDLASGVFTGGDFIGEVTVTGGDSLVDGATSVFGGTAGMEEFLGGTSAGRRAAFCASMSWLRKDELRT